MAGLMGGSGWAGAAEPTTTAATGMCLSTATLNGSIQTAKLATLWQFQYGTNTSYGKTTPANSIPAGGSAIIVSTGINGLKPNTKYHFRLVVQTGSGTPYPIVVTHGADMTFTTKPTVALSSTTLKIKNGS